MQIVIDIPEKLACEGFERHFTEEEKNILIRAIGNGTPLPKGHGALIDREELRNKYASWYNLAIDKSINAVLTLELYQIEPIIKADGGNAE